MSCLRWTVLADVFMHTLQKYLLSDLFANRVLNFVACFLQTWTLKAHNHLSWQNFKHVILHYR